MKASIIFRAMLLIAAVQPVCAATLVVDSTTNRNDFSGVVGFRFTSTSPTTQINYLGFVDDGGDGLDAAHTVGLYLWDGSKYVLERSIEIAAGSSATLYNGYRWASISPITLANQGITSWLVAATVGNGDGDSWGQVPGVSALNTAIGQLNTTVGPAGYYDGSATTLGDPLRFGGGQGFANFYNAANIATVVPEASSLLFVGFGSLLLLKRKRI